MSTSLNDNKAIAKNTFFLYGRTFFVMSLGLFTSRIVLGALGVQDFGIYNVVGGFVSMCYILSASITVAISRFFAFELGKDQNADLSRIFSTAINLQLLISLIILVLLETAGVWFVNSKMDIPLPRLQTANTMYHFIVASFVVSLMCIPYSALVIAHEKMSFFAYIGILDAVLKFAAALAVSYFGSDKLLFYSFLMLMVPCAQFLVYVWYCSRKLPLCRYRILFDKSLFVKIVSYAGWTYIGTTSAILRDQGGNIMINIFYGPVANAARGVASQVQSALHNFALNFTTPIKPQIIKNYASGDLNRVKTLIFYGATISYYLLFVIALPVFINTEYILSLWLKTVPPQTEIFVRLSMVFILSEVISEPLIIAASARNNIRNYQLLVGGIQLLNLPFSYFALKVGYPSYAVVVVAVLISQCCLFARLLFLWKVMDIPVVEFIVKCYFRIAWVSAISLVVPVLLSRYFERGFCGLLASCAVCVCWSLFVVFFMGLDKPIRIFIFGKIRVFCSKFFALLQ